MTAVSIHPPLRESQDIVHDAAALRQRAQEDGYLFIRGLMPRDGMLELRRQMIALLHEFGWIKPSGDPLAAVAARPGTWEGQAEFAPYYDRVQLLEVFHALPHHQPVLDVLGQVFGETALPHPRNIARTMFPDTPTTPPHQDYFPVRGTQNTWTCWAPLGDCPQTLGGLAVLPGRHREGLMAVKAMPGAGGAGIEFQMDESAWHTTDFQVGDALLLHSMLPHASLPNRSNGLMRLSVDYRYQPVSEEIDVRSLLPHQGRLTWEQVYAGWQSQRYQYYWKDLPLKTSDYWTATLAKSGY